MLRITVLETTEALTFRVEGKLVGQWAEELEQAWKEAAAIRGHRAPIVDLSETLFVDEQGRRVLAKLFREGAFFRTADPMTESIVSEITGKSKPVWPSRVAQSVLLLLLATALKQNPQVQIANLKRAVTQENQIVARAGESRVELAKALFDQASDMQKNGIGTAIDALRANVQHQNEQQRLIEAHTARATGQMESLYAG